MGHNFTHFVENGQMFNFEDNKTSKLPVEFPAVELLEAAAVALLPPSAG